MADNVIEFSLPDDPEEHEVAILESQAKAVVAELLSVPLGEIFTEEKRDRCVITYPNPRMKLYGSSLTVVEKSWWRCLRVIQAGAIADGVLPDPTPPPAA